MDTDDFSEMAYNIIVQAARVSDTLKTELGVLSRNHKNKTLLVNEHDVDRYLEALREAYLAEIRHGKKVQI